MDVTTAIKPIYLYTEVIGYYVKKSQTEFCIFLKEGTESYALKCLRQDMFEIGQENNKEHVKYVSNPLESAKTFISKNNSHED